MGREDPRYLVVGHLDKPHGIHGEIYVWPLTDHPESVYAPGVVCSLGGEDADEPDPDMPPLRVVAARPYRKGLLVCFGGVDDRSQAELLRGRYLFRPSDELEPLREGEVYYHQLVGLEVVTVDGQALGRVSEVYEMQPADLLEVSGDGGQRMIPYLGHIVVEVDVRGGRVVIDPPDGLLDL
jgi:16S rRNA processing protein RimM